MIKQRIAAGLLSLSALGALGIVAHEGMRRVAYVDPVGVVTVCAGHTATAKLGQVKTDAECAALLQKDVNYSEGAIRQLITVPVTQVQFDALVSFTFNVGRGAFERSTLRKKVNAGDCWGAGKEFSRWTYAGGRELPGLVKRRAYERKQWETGCASGKYTTQAERIPALAGKWAQARRPEPHAFAILA